MFSMIEVFLSYQPIAPSGGIVEVVQYALSTMRVEARLDSVDVGLSAAR